MQSNTVTSSFRSNFNLLSYGFVLLVFLFAFFAAPGRADWAKTGDDLHLGTLDISSPTVTENRERIPWKGSYVYYGHFEGKPVKYRVLAPRTTDFGIRTMLLDCDTTLKAVKYYNDNRGNSWADSDARAWLNGTEFLLNPDVFTSVEQSAVAESRKELTGETIVNDHEQYNYLCHTSLDGDKIFLLDVSEVTNPDYGYPFDQYSNSYPYNATRMKEGYLVNWLLRSPYPKPADDRYYNTGFVTMYGVVDITGATCEGNLGVSPAFNVSLSSVIFSSLISGTAGQTGAEYKLTLRDPGMNIAPVNVMRSGNTVTAAYKITGYNAGQVNRVSALVTDGTWSDGKGWSGGSVKFYGPLTVGAGGTGTFDLPEDYDSSWKVYILAEVVNGEKETDYASSPVEIDVRTIYATVTADNKSKTIGEPDPELTATVTGLVKGDSINYTLTRAAGEAEGTYAITPSGAAEQGNYIVKFVSGNLTILEELPDVEPDGGSENIPASALKDPVEDSPVAEDEDVKKIVEEALGGKNVFFVSVVSMDQTDNRTKIQKVKAAKKAVEANRGDADLKITSILVLPLMRPQETGIYIFHLPLMSAMKEGDFLIWFPGAEVLSGDVNVAAGLEPGGAVFIDEAARKVTDVVPEGRQVAVAAYLESEMEYEPVVLTKRKRTSSPSGGGCDVGFGFMAFAFILPWVTVRKRK